MSSVECEPQRGELGTISKRENLMNMMKDSLEVEGEEYEGGRACLIINKCLKSTMIRNIRRIKRFARVHIWPSPYAPGMEIANFYGNHNQIKEAMKEFISKFMK